MYRTYRLQTCTGIESILLLLYIIFGLFLYTWTYYCTLIPFLDMQYVNLFQHTSRIRDTFDHN